MRVNKNKTEFSLVIKRKEVFSPPSFFLGLFLEKTICKFSLCQGLL